MEPEWAFCYEVSESTISEASEQSSMSQKEIMFL